MYNFDRTKVHSIPNTTIEKLFRKWATANHKQKYLNFIQSKNTGLATAYASRFVYTYISTLEHKYNKLLTYYIALKRQTSAL